MGRTWVLRTETKGTGAEMVPLERVTTGPSEPEPVFVRRKPVGTPRTERPSPRRPHQFKIVEVLTRQVLAERSNTRDAVEVLRNVRSPVDIDVYVWREESGRWRLLTFEEKRALWDLRDD
jgi:hypothetical protein